jgi:ribosome-associated heat shock protein Hsp15
MDIDGHSVRVDRWLCAARLFKSRAEAQKACAGGLVKVNDTSVRSSHRVRVGDRISAQAPRGLAVLVVVNLEEKRQPASRARELYEDHSPPPPPREDQLASRHRGAGRPTKSERRAIERLRRFYD